MIGTVFADRYEIRRSLGSGGMADVYLAHDLRLGRDVALKVLPTRYAADPHFVERFRREAGAAARLSHPHIVHIYDWGEADGTYVICMEYVPGRSLKQVIVEEAPLPPDQLAAITRQILAALGCAHAAGVIHRDVKPQNIIVDEAGWAKVTDFGIARAGGDSGLTQTGTILGTAQYLSPEQARGDAVSPASDFYSLGVVVYEMATGRPPFTADNAIAVGIAHINDAPSPPRSWVPDLPQGLENIILRALAKSPDDRYGSPAEFLADLDRFAAGERIPAPDSFAASNTLLKNGVSPSEGDGHAREKDAGSANSSAIGATEDVLSGRPAPSDGRGSVLQQPAKTAVRPVTPVPAAGEGVRLEVTQVRPRADTWVSADEAGAAFGAAVTPAGGAGSPPRTTAFTAGAGAGAKAGAELARSGAPEAAPAPENGGRRGRWTRRPLTWVLMAVLIAILGGGGYAAATTLLDRVRTVVVPDLVGQTLSEAGAILEPLELTAEEGGAPLYSDDIGRGHIMRQQPEAQMSTRVRGAVLVWLSAGPEPVSVPALVGKSKAEAVSALEARRLKASVVEEVRGDQPPGQVFAQSPEGGIKLEPGSTVEIRVALAPPTTTRPPTTTTTTTTLPPEENKDRSFWDSFREFFGFSPDEEKEEDN